MTWEYICVCVCVCMYAHTYMWVYVWIGDDLEKLKACLYKSTVQIQRDN